jgi:hypothetical protein
MDCRRLEDLLLVLSLKKDADVSDKRDLLVEISITTPPLLLVFFPPHVVEVHWGDGEGTASYQGDASSEPLGRRCARHCWHFLD